MPKRVSVWNQIDVIGKLWMGGTAAYSYEPTASDVENMRDEDGLITREGVEAWLDTHSGDFQSVTDFSVDFGASEFVSIWATEESEMTFNGAMFGEEE
jgi:ABC-type Zn uptake system ZnuABC Zn-binding protein ZnuA